MKDFFSKSRALFFILFGFLIVFWLFYVWQFHDGLSSDQSIWAEFGDFFNGVVSPIFAAINICIFWYLTKAVEENNKKRQEEIDANEDRRRQQDAEHQKAMYQMQFRIAEIDRLEEILRNVLAPENVNHNDGFFSYTHASTIASSYILNFVQTKLDLFGLKKSDKTARNLRKLNNILNDLCDNLNKAAAEEAFLNDKDIDMSNLDKTYTEFLRLKGSIIADLHRIAFNQ